MTSAGRRSRPQLIVPFKYLPLRRRFGNRAFRLLDVGAGNHASTNARAAFPNCRYSGIDLRRDYNNTEADIAAMDAFYEMDLTRLEFDPIPDSAFDAILMAHVIEHLHNGEEVLRGMVRKLAPGGLLYVEFPGVNSLRLPSMRGTLNFHDDESHVRLYTAREVAEVLGGAGLRVRAAGTRRDWRSIAFLPFRVLQARLKYGFVPGSALWDLLGFAEYVIAEKPEEAGATSS